MHTYSNLLDIEINAKNLLDALYEQMLPEGQCYPIKITRGQAVANVEAIVRQLCTIEWDKLSAESEAHYEAYRDAGGKCIVEVGPDHYTQRYYKGSALNKQEVEK